MLVAITSSGDLLESKLDLRFGRAKGFIIYDDESGDFKHLDNTQNLQASQGAGIQAGQTIANSGAKVLITGHVGPKAFNVLETANIKIFIAKEGSVKNAIEAWKAGKLEEQGSANVEGHWL